MSGCAAASARGRSPAASEASQWRLRLTQLYRDHAEGVRARVRRVVKSQAEAEDIVQEAFIRLWRWKDFEAFKSPRAVLYKTAFRLALNRLRDGAVNPLDCAAPLVDDLLSAPAATPEEALIGSERERAFREALRGLPPRCRQIVELRAGQNRSYKEISASLDVAVSTLEKHMARAKRVFFLAV